MEKLITLKQWKRMTEEYDKVKYICPCGHRVIIPKRADRVICGWCGNYVFKNQKDEFKYRMNEKLKKGNYETNNKKRKG